MGNISLTVNGGTAPYSYDWLHITSGPETSIANDLTASTYEVTITDAKGCSVVLSDLVVADDCVECVDVVAISNDTLATYNCEGQIPYCVDIDLEEIVNYYITDNSLPYEGAFWGCEFDSVLSYSIFTIPSQGTFGPYVVNSWNVNGEHFNGEFMTVNDLVDSMNVWDTSSHWTFDQNTLLISGGNPQNSYSNMTITQVITNAFAVLDVNINLVPNSTTLSLDEGPHVLVFTDTTTGCVDTLNVEVFCLTPDVIVDTIYVNESDTICITSDELPGNIIGMDNVCEESSGEFVLFELIDNYCVSCLGYEVGTDSACMILCDDFGYCDTTYMFITVIEEQIIEEGEVPIAIPDSTAIKEGSEVDIVVMSNDTINGILDTIYVLDPPTHGDVVVNDDGTMTYVPDEEYCNSMEPDNFTYVLCNTFGCDTTYVTVLVICKDLTVFTGFSPNGDGVNDTFFIEGILNYPDSELSVFNRWGNEVFFAKGYLNDWDGSWSGKMLPDGTYFYVLEDGEGNSYSGYVQIHR